jgi:transcriptional regulator with XRE-family HTH domain
LQQSSATHCSSRLQLAAAAAYPLDLEGGVKLDPEALEQSRTERLQALGEYIRSERNRASISLRELAKLAQVSDPYLSQIERGLHEPSIRILTSIAQALDLRSDTLLGIAAGNPTADPSRSITEAAILTDPQLDADQRQKLLRAYRDLTEGDGG